MCPYSLPAIVPTSAHYRPLPPTIAHCWSLPTITNHYLANAVKKRLRGKPKTYYHRRFCRILWLLVGRLTD
eukprot:442396-Prymnesium_polylepis.1